MHAFALDSSFLLTSDGGGNKVDIEPSKLAAAFSVKAGASTDATQ